MNRRLLRTVLALAVAAISVPFAATASSAVPVTQNIPFRCSIAVFGSTYEADGLQTIAVTVDAPAATVINEETDFPVTFGSLPINGSIPLQDVQTVVRPTFETRV